MEKRSTNVSDQTRKPLGHKFGIANPELRGDKDLWTEAGLNARGQVAAFTLGNGLSTSRTFDDYGFPKSIITGSVQDLEYEFNPATGNLNWRKDYLGSLYCITDEHGQVVTNASREKQVYSFDPWGRRRNYKDWSYDGASTSYLFDRGFTGHEMLPEFGLINMNGRVYDPRLARFLSPDNFVQSDNSQNFNRYSYVLNNPLKYTDSDGEIFGTAFTFLWDLGTTIFTKGGIDPWNTPENRREAWEKFDPTAEWSKTNKAWKIDKGLFVTDPNRTTAGRALQLISRFTWELPQTAVGNLFSHFRNVSGSVTNVDYYGGATLVNQNDPKKHGWGLTMGSYINSVNLEADPYKDETFRHEYGHTIQSRILGPFYLKHVGLPSFVGSFLDYNLHINNHNDEWYEVQANRLSLRYFENHDPGALDPSQGGTEWNYDRYFGYPTTYKFNWYTIPSIVIGFFPIPYLL